MAFSLAKNILKGTTLSFGAFVAAPTFFAFIAYMDMENNKEKHLEELANRKPLNRVGKPMIRADQPDLSMTAMIQRRYTALTGTASPNLPSSSNSTKPN